MVDNGIMSFLSPVGMSLQELIKELQSYDREDHKVATQLQRSLRGDASAVIASVDEGRAGRARRILALRAEVGRRQSAGRDTAVAPQRARRQRRQRAPQVGIDPTVVRVGVTLVKYKGMTYVVVSEPMKSGNDTHTVGARLHKVRNAPEVVIDLRDASPA